MWKAVNRTTASRHGHDVEQRAARWLQARGLRVICRNYRCRAGELDLVMHDGNTLVFVEVRYRKSQRFGGAVESVDPSKQHKLILAARHYLAASRRYGNMPCRFDVLAAAPAVDNRTQLHWQWIKNAFSC